MPTLADLTTEQITQSVRRSLITEYGDQWWTYPMAVKANASPMVVVYERNNAAYRRTFTIEFVGDFPNAILGGEESEVVAQTVYVDVPANFSAPEGDAASVSWSGKLFNVGDYGAKGAYWEPELESFVSTFPPTGVPIKDSHIETFFGMCLKDHDAKVSRVWLTDDKKELHGTFNAPAWAAEAAKKRVKSVSIGLTDDRTGLKEVSLTINPHVEDAAVWEKQLAQAVATAPTFSAFAAAHPDGARLVTEAAQAPVPPPAMLTKEQKTQEAKQAYAALPQFMRDEQTEAEFVAFAIKQEDKPAKTTAEDPTLRADVDHLKAQFAHHAETTEDANASLQFFKDNFEKFGPAGEAEARAEFTDARELDRLRAHRSGVTFSAGTDGSKEKALREKVAKLPKLFSMGPGQLPSAHDLPTPGNGGLGMMHEDDFKKTSEAK